MNMNEAAAATEELKKTQAEIEAMWDDLADKIGEVYPDMKGEIAAVRARGAQRKKERDELIKKCHPDNDNHWPPHDECPVCQKMLGRVENLARQRCADPNNEEELATKFKEVFEELYCKKPEPVPENKENPQ
jgi:hypothetical protein